MVSDVVLVSGPGRDRSERGLLGGTTGRGAGRRPGVGLAATLVAAPAAAGAALAAAGAPALVAAPAAAGAALAAAGAAALVATAGPRVVVAAGLEAAATATAGAGGLADLGGRHLQARPDLLDGDLEDGARLTLAGLVPARREAALHDDPHAAGERLGGVLGRLPPDRAVQEQGVLVLPLVGLPVEGARRRGDGEVRHRGPRGGEAQLRVGGEVAHHGDRGFACHVRPPVGNSRL